jgi:hypothetical protein
MWLLEECNVPTTKEGHRKSNKNNNKTNKTQKHADIFPFDGVSVVLSTLD